MIYAFPFAMRPLCLPHPHTVLHGHKRRPQTLRLLRPFAVPSALSLTFFFPLKPANAFLGVSSPIAESASLRYARVLCVCVHALSGRRSGVRHPSLPRMQCNHLPSKPCTPTPRSRSLSRSVSPPQPRATRLWGMRSHRESFSLGDRGPRSRVSAGCVCVWLPGSLGTRSARVPESLEV